MPNSHKTFSHQVMAGVRNTNTKCSNPQLYFHSSKVDLESHKSTVMY